MIRSILAAAVLAPLGAAAAFAQQMPVPDAAQAPILLDATLLDIVAEGKTTRAPDLATINAGVVTQSATAAEAMRANSAAMARVTAALRRAGVAERDIQTSTIGLSPQYRYAENQPPVITGYQATNRVTVRFRDIAKSGAILDALVAEGANSIDGPTLGLADPDPALDAARTDAVARARARAELYARAAGLRVDRVLSISEQQQPVGPMPPPVMMAARMEAKDATEVVPGEQDITATLWVRFLLR